MREVRIITTFNHARYVQHNVYLRTYTVDMQISYPLMYMPAHDIMYIHTWLFPLYRALCGLDKVLVHESEHYRSCFAN